MRLSLERQREASQVCWALVVFKRGFDILSSLYEVSRKGFCFFYCYGRYCIHAMTTFARTPLSFQSYLQLIRVTKKRNMALRRLGSWRYSAICWVVSWAFLLGQDGHCMAFRRTKQWFCPIPTFTLPLQIQYQPPASRSIITNRTSGTPTANS